MICIGVWCALQCGGGLLHEEGQRTQRAVHRCKEGKKMDAVHAAAEHKIEPIARAAASCSSAWQIMFQIKKSPTPLNGVTVTVVCGKRFPNPPLHPMQ